MDDSLQKIEYIGVKDLVLWTENPRDPISSTADNQDIVNRALSVKKEKWALAALAKEMGNHFDFSELPTVVYIDEKPVVYDGNRRVILAKIALNLVDSPVDFPRLPVFPEKIPCNVCSEAIAIDNVYRKHANTGSWDPIARDIFLAKFKNEEKTPFLLIDELTNGAISSEKALNQRFVRDELLTSGALKKLGISVEKGLLQSVHTYDEIMGILNDLFSKVKNGTISTRNNRGMVEEVLEPENQNIINRNKQNKEYKAIETPKTEPKHTNLPANKPARTTRVVSVPTPVLFGKKLLLEKGQINNLYRDISAIYDYYEANKRKFSDNFWALIRMSLRLICETASKDKGFSRIDDYISAYFVTAKGMLNKDEKTTLSNQSITDTKMPQLLHTGAHNYMASKSEEQTRALALIVGAMLIQSHGKK